MAMIPSPTPSHGIPCTNTSRDQWGRLPQRRVEGKRRSCGQAWFVKNCELARFGLTAETAVLLFSLPHWLPDLSRSARCCQPVASKS
jgi:hypothetical protein